MKLRLRECGKTLLIVLLILSMLLMCWHLWFRENIGDIGTPGVYAASAVRLVTAAYPVRIVVGDGVRKLGVTPSAGAAFLSEYLRLSAVIGPAISSSGVLSEAREEVFRTALSRPFVLFEYLDPVPLRSLAAWMVVSPPDTLNGHALRVVLAWDEAASFSTIFLQMPDGSWMQCETTPNALPAPTVGEECLFAFNAADVPSRSDPYTVLFPGVRRESIWESVPLSGIPVACLRAFSFPNTNMNSFTESDGTVVFVHGQRLLRFSPDGRVQYSSFVPDSADDIGPAVSARGTQITEEDIIEVARKLSELAVFENAGLEMYAGLSSVRQDLDGNDEVLMRLFLGGIPLAQNSIHVVIRNGVVIRADLTLRAYSRTDETLPVWGDMQASVLAAQDTRPALAFTERDGQLIPGWVTW